MYSKRVKKHRELIVKIAYKLFDMKMPTMAETLLLAAHEIGDSTILHSTPESSVLHGVVGLLEDLKIKYALIGGVAFASYGYFVGTDDVDILVDFLPSNEILKNKEYMKTFGFYPSKSYTGGHLVLDHKNGQVEMLPADNTMRKEALKTRKNRPALKANVPVVSLEALVGLKLQALFDNPRRESDDKPAIVFAMTKLKTTHWLDSNLDKEEKNLLKSISPSWMR